MAFRHLPAPPAIRQAIEAVGMAPPPRILILLSTGVGFHNRQDMAKHIESISRVAADAEVQVFAVTEVIDGLEMKDWAAGRAAARQAENRFLGAGLQTVASAAGGEAFRVIGEAQRFFDRIVEQTSAFYRIGVDAPSAISADGHVTVDVKVNRRDVRVLTRRQVVRK